MDGLWPVIFMLVLLKIPAVGMIWLLYWAATNEQENGVIDEGQDGGGKRRPRPFRPRGPRRGPHGGDTVAPSPRRSRRAEPAIGQRIRTGSHRPEPARAREHEPTRS